MTTYTIEEIQRLNGCLLELQREHLCNTTTTAAISDTSLTPQQAWEDNDKTQFLLAANQALDGLLSRPHQLADIDTYLTWYASFQQDNDDQLNDSVLDWLFVTKCTLAVYGYSLSSILQSTLPLSESLAYWDNIYGNPWYEVYYGLQSKCFSTTTA
jgi:nuclear-control-of-ATPase protein 2